MPPAERLHVFAQAKARQEQADDRKQAQKRLANSIRSVMSSREGRRTIRWILDVTAHEQSVSNSDALLMAISSGRRDVGIEVLRRLKTLCPESVILMDKESFDE